LLRRLSTALALLLASQLAFAVPVAAADFGNCANNYPNGITFAGYNGPQGTTKYGVAGILDTQTLHQCSNPGFIVTTGSFAWNALDGGGGSDGNVIMQIGTGECRDPGVNGCDSGFHAYYAWGRDASATGCSGFSHRNATPQNISDPDGQPHDMKVQWSSGGWQFYIGNTLYRTLGLSNICWTPHNATWFEEAWDSGDALGGSIGDHERTNQANYQNTKGGGFFFTNFPTTCTFPQSVPRHCVQVNSNTFDVWTDR
jgi:hypothetical protein